MGLNRDGLERFAGVAASHVGDVGDDKVPGLVALVARGDEVHVEAFGRLAVGGRPVERGSLFRISSTTKPITAAATLALVGEGLLDLDEPVDRLLPELANRRVLRRMDGPVEDTFPAAGPVTVRGPPGPSSTPATPTPRPGSPATPAPSWPAAPSMPPPRSSTRPTPAASAAANAPAPTKPLPASPARPPTWTTTPPWPTAGRSPPGSSKARHGS
jgi:hypothetical protein